MPFGSVTAEGDKDHTAKLYADGLQPGRWYFYRFVAPDGTKSPTGRTRTLPQGPTRAFNLALFSCANMPFGWFNAYGHAAARGDNEMINYLVSKGANVKAVDREGRTTVDMANGPVQRIQPFPETIKLLESLGAVNNHKCVSC